MNVQVLIQLQRMYRSIIWLRMVDSIPEHVPICEIGFLVHLGNVADSIFDGLPWKS